MATVQERLDESTGAGLDLPAPSRRLDRLSTLGVLAAYVALCAVLLAGTMLAAAYLAAALPGIAGAVAFLTVGVGLVAAAPAAARALLKAYM